MSQQILSLIVASKTVTFYLFITQAWEKGTYFCLLVGSGSFYGLCDICQEYTKTSFCFVLSRCVVFLLLVAWESSRHFTGVSTKWRPRKDSRSSVLMTYHYPDLGSASDWLKQNSISTSNQKHHHDLVLTRHQYGISALVSQTSFRGNPMLTSQNVSCLLGLFFKSVSMIRIFILSKSLFGV